MSTVKKLFAALMATAMVAALTGFASAQPQSQHQANQSHGQKAPRWGQDNRPAQAHWKRGQRMGYNDWRRAQPVDYRAHRLRQPPRGYEWREQNGQYILAAVATGLIASIILQSGH